MESSEYDIAYNELTILLKNLQLDWAITQIEQQVAQGKIVQKEDVPVLKNLETGKTYQQMDLDFTGKRADFMALETYTPADRLRIALDVVQMVIDYSLMEWDVVNFFTAGTDAHEVILTEDNEQEGDIVLRRNYEVSPLQRFQPLLTMVTRLIKELEDANT